MTKTKSKTDQPSTPKPAPARAGTKATKVTKATKATKATKVTKAAKATKAAKVTKAAKSTKATPRPPSRAQAKATSAPKLAPAAAAPPPPPDTRPPPYDREAAVRHLLAVDPALVPVITRVGPCTLAIRAEVETFAALTESIVYQQLNGRAARTIFDRLRAALGDELTPERVEATADELLRGAGLSGAKLRAIRDLCRHALAGQLPSRLQLEALDDEVVVQRLTVVRGIGRWTAEMLLMFRLGRPDVLPVTDYGVRQGFKRVHDLGELPVAQALADYGERWRPFRSVAAWYLWRAAEAPP